MDTSTKIMECSLLAEGIYRIHFSDGTELTVDTRSEDWLREARTDSEPGGPGEPEIAMQGTLLRWPGGVEFCVNALLSRAHDNESG